MSQTFDLHVHTEASPDAASSPAELVREAKRENLDGLAITDHNTGEGIEPVREKAGEDLLVIPGMEVSTKEGHILGYFLSERTAPDTIEPLEVIDWIHDQGGVAVLAHPFVRRSSVSGKITEKLDGIELKNYRYSQYPCPQEDVDRTECILGVAHQYNLTLTGGSDAHTPAQVGFCYTEIDSEPERSELKSSLQNGFCDTEGESMTYLNYLMHRLKRFFSFTNTKGASRIKKKKKKKKRK